MTIESMLRMSTCHASATVKLDTSIDWIESFFITPPTHKPGTIFHYDTSASHTLCALVEKLTNKNLLEYLRTVILDEIGFSKEAYLLTDPFGHSHGGSGLMATSEDLLKLGLFFLANGTINNKQLIDSTLLQKATSFLTPTAMTGPVSSECQGYGYQIWRGEHDAYVCYGMGGQLIICYPKEQLLCVTTADTQGIGGGNQFIYESIYQHLLSSLSDIPFENNKEELARLQNITSTLKLLPAKSLLAHIEHKNFLLPEIKKINDITYFLQNSDFNQVKLSFSKDKGIFSYSYKSTQNDIPFGLSECIPGFLNDYQMKCVSSGVWLDQNTFYLRVNILDTAIGSIHFQFYFTENDVILFIKKIEESLFSEYNGHFYGTKKELL